MPDSPTTRPFASDLSLSTYSASPDATSSSVILSQTRSSEVETAIAPPKQTQVTRDRLRQAFQDCRTATLRQFEQLPAEWISTQAHPDFSPAGWHLGHIAYTEALWLLQHCAGFPPQFPQYQTLLAADGLPKVERQNLPSLSELRDYLDAIRQPIFSYLDFAPIHKQERLWHFILQHESQHSETIAIVLALLQQTPPASLPFPSRVAPPFPLPPAPSSSLPSTPSIPPWMCHVPSGSFIMGYDGPEALDNERPAHEVEVDEFWMDAHPVTYGEFNAFIQAGGYEDAQWWSDAGWEWRSHHSIPHPLYWPLKETTDISETTQASEAAPSTSQDLPLDYLYHHPVCGVSWYEADAYARFVGKRLPTEAEWEKAARWNPTTRTCSHYPWGDAFPARNHANHHHHHGNLSPVTAYPDGKSAVGCWDMLGNVWEWTADWFVPYDGFQPYPYVGYSQAYFDQQHRVLRGGSWATRPWSLRATLRNWYHPHVREIFAGFRCAKS